MSLVKTVTGPNEGELFTARSFLDYLRRSNDRWWSKTSGDGECQWVFRGQENADWDLLPHAGRALGPANKLTPIVKKLRERTESTEQNKEMSANIYEQWLLLEAHTLSVQKFASLGRELGFDLQDIPRNRVLETGKFITTDLCLTNYPLNMVSSLKGRNYLLSDTIALAQHHGIPTFFLDWTDNPLTAIFFASGENRANADLVVWALNTNFVALPIAIVRLLKMPELKAYCPSTTKNLFLQSQHGVLTYFEGTGDFFEKNEEYPSVNKVFEGLARDAAAEAVEKHHASFKDVGTFSWLTPETIALQKIILPKSEVVAVRQLLQREGISQAHMMPTLDNVAATAMRSIADSFEN